MANGTSSTPSNAITVLKSGNTGIGTDVPTALLHTNGTGTGQGNVLFVGQSKLPDPGDPPVSGTGTRMMWYPDKGAFRVGHVTGTNWNKDSIGIYSVALGYDTKAKGYYSTAMGLETTASGDVSTAMGYNTTASGFRTTAIGSGASASGFYTVAIGSGTNASANFSTAMGASTTASANYSTAMGSSTNASGDWSTAMGSSTNASGNHSTAMGSSTNASGNYSTAIGHQTTASALASTAIGRYNIGNGEANNWTLTDPIFEIGVGTSESNKHNAMTVLKNGNTGIGTINPGGNRLRVVSSVSGGTNSTGFFENTHSSGLALRASTNSSDGTILSIQEGDGYSLRCDGYDPNWFVAMIVKGRQVGINTSAPTQNLDVNGNARFRSIASDAYHGVLNRKSDGTLTTATSDIRFKENILTLENSLERVKQLRGVSFTWKSNPEYGTRIGFIAQEFEKVMPELAFINPTDGFMGINYAEMTAVLVEAMKEQQAIIDEQNKRIDKQLTINEEQEKRIDELERKLEQLLHKFSENK
ncbi:MAG: tail fiber domain-containing protein [Candidatus Kapabacteria bacterium]|nr:tail fiber domain-containing protein [Candidatus Kapabacteria bacterium]